MPYREAEWVLNKIWHDLILLESEHERCLAGTVSTQDADIVLLLDKCFEVADNTNSKGDKNA